MTTSSPSPTAPPPPTLGPTCQLGLMALAADPAPSSGVSGVRPGPVPAVVLAHCPLRDEHDDRILKPLLPDPQ